MAQTRGSKRKRDATDDCDDNSSSTSIPSITVQAPTQPATPPTPTANKRHRPAFDTATPRTIARAEAAPDTPSVAAAAPSPSKQPSSATFSSSTFHNTFPTLPPPTSLAPRAPPPDVASIITTVDQTNPNIIRENESRARTHRNELRLRAGLWKYAKKRATSQKVSKEDWEETLLVTPGKPQRFEVVGAGGRVPVWWQDQVQGDGRDNGEGTRTTTTTAGQNGERVKRVEVVDLTGTDAEDGDESDTDEEEGEGNEELSDLESDTSEED